MKKVIFSPLVMAMTFGVGLIAVSVWLFVTSSHQDSFQEPKNVVEEPKIEQTSTDLSSQTEIQDSEFINPLESVWIEQDQISHQSYKIKRNCLPDNELYELCSLKITKNGKVLAKFEGERRHWLRYGFFPFLGDKDKQLVVETYSGGAHCCSNYYIYDLKPRFRVVFNGGRFDGGGEIGNDLIPVDIDGNGVYEFTQSVMAFDYFWASHAGSVFPPVVFGYKSRNGKYIIENKKFSKFILSKLKSSIKSLPNWFDENEKLSGYKVQGETRVRAFVLKTFLYNVYAGKEQEAWKFFEENYNFETKDELRNALKEQLAKDLTYQHIYGRTRSSKSK